MPALPLSQDWAGKGILEHVTEGAPRFLVDKIVRQMDRVVLEEERTSVDEKGVCRYQQLRSVAGFLAAHSGEHLGTNSVSYLGRRPSPTSSPGAPKTWRSTSGWL